jgi:ABC-type transport system substrate-binding protein
MVALGVLGCRPSGPGDARAPTEPAGAPAAGGGTGSQAPASRAVAPQNLKSGGTLNVGLGQEISHLNPLVSTVGTNTLVRELAFESLLTTDLNGNIQPLLAESWDVASDGKLYTFRLRKGVRFHNGQEMTAADVKFAIDYTLNPRNGAYGLSLLDLVERVETPDPYSVRISLRGPSAAFLPRLTDIQAFSVVPNGSLEEGVDKPAAFPPGTGPFKFVEWQARQRTVFERHDDYWGQKAYVDRVVIRPIADATVRFTALRAGDVDLIDRAPYEWVKEILDGRIRGVGFAEAANAAANHLKFNAADPPFDNKKLRQAVAHALDKKDILDAAFFGFGTPAEQRYPRGHAWYFEGVPAPTYDLERARRLLQEAGYAGQTIKILTAHGGADEPEGTALQAQLRKIGMNVELEILDVALYPARTRAGEYAFSFTGGNFRTDPSATYKMLCEPDLKRRSLNTSGYCDKDLDALAERAEAEMDPPKRREMIRQIVTRLLDDLPEVTIGFIPRYFAFGEHVKWFTTDGTGRLMFYGGGLNFTGLDR